MKLYEVLGDRHSEYAWRSNVEAKPQRSDADKLKAAGMTTRGIWWLSPQGKRLAGPFETMADAERFRKNRPDRIPKDAVARRVYRTMHS